MAKQKTKKCRCRRCGKTYKPEPSIAMIRRGPGRFKTIKTKPTCIGMCDPCVEKVISKITSLDPAKLRKRSRPGRS